MRHLALLAALLLAACAQENPPASTKPSYAISDRTLGYSYAGGTYKPIENTPLGMVRNDWNDLPPR